MDLTKALLHHLIIDSNNFNIITERNITSEMFNDFNSQHLFNLFYLFYMQYNSLPTTEEVDFSINNSTRLSKEQKTGLLAYYFEILNLHDDNSFRFLVDSFIENYELENYKQTLISATELVKRKDNKELDKLFKKCIFKNTTFTNVRRSVDITKDTDETLRRYEAGKVNKNARFVRLGYDALDNVTGGIGPSDLWIVQGWAKAGKSMFLLNCAYNAWRYAGKNVLLITGEITEERMESRFNALGAEIPVKNIDFSNLTPEDEQKFKDFLKIRKEMPNQFRIIYEGAVSTLSIQQMIKEMKLQCSLDLVVVDYLGVCTPVDKGKSKEEFIGNIAVELKNIAAAEQVPILTAVQLNRSGKMSKKGGGTEFVSGSLRILQYCDLFMEIKIKDETEKERSYVYDIDASILASRNSELARTTLKCFSTIMKMA